MARRPKTVSGRNSRRNASSKAIGKNTTLTIPAPGVLLNDSNALSAVLLIPPVNGTLTFNTNGSFVYTPATNFLGSDIFAYQGRTSNNLSGPAIVGMAFSPSKALILATNNSIYRVDVGIEGRRIP